MSGTNAPGWLAALMADIKPIQTALVALASGAAPLVMAHGFAWPADDAAWMQFVVTAAIGGGLLHVTAPRNQ